MNAVNSLLSICTQSRGAPAPKACYHTVICLMRQVITLSSAYTSLTVPSIEFLNRSVAHTGVPHEALSGATSRWKIARSNIHYNQDVHKGWRAEGDDALNLPKGDPEIPQATLSDKKAGKQDL